ncbi:MAG: hypothetical protein RSE12_08860 [Fuscovulum sp.]|nr:MAG: hypothetical protein RSE12_08860 [Fuscovulum sp.]
MTEDRKEWAAAWDMCAHLQALLRAASFLRDHADTDHLAMHGLSGVLTAAERVADELLSQVDR